MVVASAYALLDGSIFSARRSSTHLARNRKHCSAAVFVSASGIGASCSAPEYSVTKRAELVRLLRSRIRSALKLRCRFSRCNDKFAAQRSFQFLPYAASRSQQKRTPEKDKAGCHRCRHRRCPYAFGDLAANLCLGLVQKVNEFHQIKTPN